MVKGYVAAALSVATVVVVLLLARIDNAGIAAPVLLFNVVVVARFWGAGPALFAASVVSANYSYHFLPPSGFGIEDRDDWLAFVIFIVTAVVAGELASRAEKRAAEAQAGRAEIERLYRELQAAFERASEAEAARRNEELKSALLDALTHNLRTPLTSIKASVTALIGAGSWGPSSTLQPEGRLELLSVIDEESDRLNRFIEGLSSSDGQGAPPRLRVRAVSLDEIVRAGLLRAETVVRDHKVRVQLDGRLPLLTVDAASIAEVVYILLDNASKYAPPGSAITIAAAIEDERHLRVTVTDEGPGIPPDLREQVFERFFRVPDREPSDPRRGGIGLGLSIARRLVEAQAGRIWIPQSMPGGGTTVTMTLPVASEAGTDTRAPALTGAGT